MICVVAGNIGEFRGWLQSTRIHRKTEVRYIDDWNQMRGFSLAPVLIVGTAENKKELMEGLGQLEQEGKIYFVKPYISKDEEKMIFQAGFRVGLTQGEKK